MNWPAFLLAGIFCCSVAFALPHGQNESPSSNAVVKDPSPAKLLTEVVELLQQGKDRTYEVETNKHKVFLVGMSESDKPTVFNVLTQLSNLEAYQAEEKYLIRPIEASLSPEADSKDTLPTRYIDTSNNISLYNMPAFVENDTLSRELVTSYWFNKIVGRCRQRIKFLFVATHSAVNCDHQMMQLLDQFDLHDKNPGKFLDGISIVVTNVTSEEPSEKIIDGIVHSLLHVKKELADLNEDVKNRQAKLNFIDALLKNSTGAFDRISFLRVPTSAGPLANMSDMIAQRDRIYKMILASNNPKFVCANSTDFHVQLSNSTSNSTSNPKMMGSSLLTNLVDHLKSSISSIQEKINREVQQGLNNSTPMSMGSYITKIEAIQKLTTYLVNNKNSLEGFQKALQDGLPTLSETLPEDVAYSLPFLTFLEKHAQDSEQSTNLESWVESWTEGIKSTRLSVDQHLNHYLIHRTKDAAEKIQKKMDNLNDTLAGSYEGRKTLRQEISTILNSTRHFTAETFKDAKTVNQFLTKFAEYLAPTGVYDPQRLTYRLPEDVNLNLTCTTSELVQWLKPFIDLRKDLEKKLTELNKYNQEEELEHLHECFNASMTFLQGNITAKLDHLSKAVSSLKGADGETMDVGPIEELIRDLKADFEDRLKIARNKTNNRVNASKAALEEANAAILAGNEYAVENGVIEALLRPALLAGHAQRSSCCRSSNPDPSN